MISEVIAQSCWFQRPPQKSSTADTAIRNFRIYVHWVQDGVGV